MILLNDSDSTIPSKQQASLSIDYNKVVLRWYGVYNRMQGRSESSVIIGIDIGSWTFKVSVFRGKSFQILTNQANFRETPSLVSFGESFRHVGEQAENRIKSNYMNTIRSPLRLIGIEKSYDLVEEELKYTTVKYDLADELHFIVQVDKGRGSRVQPEHLLISLLGKVYKIVESHGLIASSYVLTVPSYMSHYQRKIVKRCGEIVLHSQDITLIDDWLSLASEYAYNKIIELKTCEPRIVVLLDIGYAKCSFFVVEFTKKDFRLLDTQHLRYVGSKNMDHLLAEFYDRKLKTQLKTEQSIFAAHKALVKMVEQIEKQRKILSANEDSHLNIESLIQDADLSYNMRREEFESIVGLVLADIKAGLVKIKERMPPAIKPYSVELIGGASRIPSIKALVQEVFKMDPSRSLNQSESMARGASVFGAVTAKLWPLFYQLKDMNLVDICACWNATGVNNIFFGQNETQYTKKDVIFKCNGVVPDQNVLSFNDVGQVQLYIYYGHVVATRSIGYIRFNSPNRVRFSLDKNKIVNVRLEWGDFLVCKMQDKKESKWSDLHRWESELQINEERIRMIQLLKNQYEAKFYELRGKIEQFKEYMNEEEKTSIFNQFTAIQGFIQEENYRKLHSEADLELYRTKLNQMKEYSQPLAILQQRKSTRLQLIQKYELLKLRFQGAEPYILTEKQSRKFRLLLQWTLDSHSKMKESNWEGYYLTEVSLNFAIQELQRILNMR